MYNPVGRHHRGPLVGREEELYELYELFKTIEASASQELQMPETLPFDILARRPYGLFLKGEAGIGKTRLAEELAEWAQQRGWEVIWNRAYEQEQMVSYWLWSKVLRSCIQSDLWMPEEERSSALFLPLTKLLPELADQLSTDKIAFAPSSEQEPFVLWEAVLAVFKSLGTQAPLLLVLDDIHWADESSCKLLGYLLRRLVGSRVLILCTYRQEEFIRSPLAPLVGHLQRERLVTTMQLHALSNVQIHRLLSVFPAQISEIVVQRIQEQAAGNPFFAEELVYSASIDTELHLPKSIADALHLRLARLSPACQRLLSRAAVLGGSFEMGLINALAQSMFPALPVDELQYSSPNEGILNLLEEALQVGILTESGVGAHITYAFWHPLMVTHLYEHLSATRRARLHRQVAGILQQVYSDRLVEQVAIITHHLLKGGASAQEIVYYAEMAADHAYALSSYPEAEKHYRIVLENLSLLSIQFEAVDRLSDEQLRRATLLELLGECTRIQGKFAEARQTYEQALYLRQQHVIAKSSETYQYEAQIQALLWCEIGLTWYDIGKNEQALQCYRRGEEILQDARVAASPAWAYIRYLQGSVSWREGMYKQAYSQANEVLNLFEALPDQPAYAMDDKHSVTRIGRILARDPVILGRTYALLGLTANGAGRSIEALHQLNIALTLFEQHGIQREVAVVCCNLGDVYLRKADYASAQAFFRRSLSVAEQIGEFPLVAFVFGNLSLVEVRRGNLIEAENHLRQGISLAEHVNDTLYLSTWYAYLSTVLLEQGELDEAYKALYHAIVTGRDMHITPFIDLALVTVGHIRITQALAVGVENESAILTPDKISRMLKRAGRTLQHALVLEGVEAETRTEGRLLLARASLLLGDIGNAQKLAVQTLEEAHQFDLTWLIAQAQCMLGCVWAAQAQQENAVSCFEHALRTFRETGMRLEYARTLYHYGEMLAQQEHINANAYQRGLGYLREAREIFEKCKAALDLQMVERVLANYEQVSGLL